MIKDGLLNAARVLEDQAAGRVPDRARLLSGALALDALQWSGEADRDILDAAAGLKRLATGGALDLNDAGRARAAALAAAVRRRSAST